MTLHVKFRKDITLEAAHNLASHVEGLIRDQLGIEATIHMEPLSGRPDG
jgi:divalent metal cation (Fe/Co/Zn/Cd) transporter